jgi:hypothetical protein
MSDLGNQTLNVQSPSTVTAPTSIKRLEFVLGDAVSQSVITIRAGVKDANGTWRTDVDDLLITVTDDPIERDPDTGLPLVNPWNANRKIPATTLFELFMQSVTPTTPRTTALGIANKAVRAVLATYLRAVGKL